MTAERMDCRQIKVMIIIDVLQKLSIHVVSLDTGIEVEIDQTIATTVSMVVTPMESLVV
jgi:hypothetical protein